MAYVLRGTASFPAGAGELSRVLDIPAVSTFGAVGTPTTYLSHVKTADPADAGLFDFDDQYAGGIIGSSDGLKAYLGGRQITLYYHLSGGSDLDVQFELVWGEPGTSDVELQYNGE
jgi:hypothetical protein